MRSEAGAGVRAARELPALRMIRESLLRQSSIALDFFARLAHDCYAFDVGLGHCVGPLLRLVALAHQHDVASVPAQLGAAFAKSVHAADPIAPRQIEAVLAQLSVEARQSSYIRWALIEPLEILARGLSWRTQGMAGAELGRRLGRALAVWAGRLPLTEAWRDLSDVALARELAVLRRVLLRDAAARAVVGRRLRALIGDDGYRCALLAEAGYLAGD
jgi:hypothetical protein